MSPMNYLVLPEWVACSTLYARSIRLQPLFANPDYWNEEL